MTIDLHTLLRDLLSDPAARAAYDADPGGWLAGNGHDLPDELVGEAITQVAAGLPAAAAESVAPFVMADSPIPHDDAGDLDGSGLDVLRAADPISLDQVSEARDVDGDANAAFGSGADADPAVAPATTTDASFDDGDADDWGSGLDGESPLDDPFAPDTPEPLGLGSDSVVDTDTGMELDDDPMDLDGLE